MEGTQFWQLYAALIHAYPTETDLAELVQSTLGANLPAITATPTMQERVFDVIHWAEAQGKLADLVAVAQQRQPGNPRLQALAVPPQPTAEQRDRAQLGRTLGYAGQWVLVIGLVGGCQVVVVANLVAAALDRFSVGDNVLAWIYLLVGSLLLLTVTIGILSTIRSEMRKRVRRP
jgi:hypothetical protein